MGAGGKTYYYDTNGRLVNEALRSNEIMEYQYDLNGNVKRKFRSNNMLVNPNFELNTSRATDIANGWDKWSDTGSALFQVIPASVVSKSVAQKVSASGMRLGTAAWLFQDVAVKGTCRFCLMAMLVSRALTKPRRPYVSNISMQPIRYCPKKLLITLWSVK